MNKNRFAQDHMHCKPDVNGNYPFRGLLCDGCNLGAYIFDRDAPTTMLERLNNAIAWIKNDGFLYNNPKAEVILTHYTKKLVQA